MSEQLKTTDLPCGRCDGGKSPRDNVKWENGTFVGCLRCYDERIDPAPKLTGDGVIFTMADLETWRAELEKSQEAFLQSKRNYLALKRKVEAAEFLSRQMHSDQMAAEFRKS